MYFKSAGQALLFPGQTSAISHTPRAERHVTVAVESVAKRIVLRVRKEERERENISGLLPYFASEGQVLRAPVQCSGESQTPAEARQSWVFGL